MLLFCYTTIIIVCFDSLLEMEGQDQLGVILLISLMVVGRHCQLWKVVVPLCGCLTTLSLTVAPVVCHSKFTEENITAGRTGSFQQFY